MLSDLKSLKLTYSLIVPAQTCPILRKSGIWEPILKRQVYISRWWFSCLCKMLFLPWQKELHQGFSVAWLQSPQHKNVDFNKAFQEPICHIRGYIPPFVCICLSSYSVHLRCLRAHQLRCLQKLSALTCHHLLDEEFVSCPMLLEGVQHQPGVREEMRDS